MKVTYLIFKMFGIFHSRFCFAVRPQCGNSALILSRRLRKKQRVSHCTPNDLPDTVSESSIVVFYPVSCNSSYITVLQ